MSTPESKIQSAVLKRLKDMGVFAWRQNNLSVYDKKLGMYRSHNGLKGVSDIIAMMKVGDFCVTIWIEVKTPKGKVSSDQFLFKKIVEKNGGFYYLARKTSDADIIYEKVVQRMWKRIQNITPE